MTWKVHSNPYVREKETIFVQFHCHHIISKPRERKKTQFVQDQKVITSKPGSLYGWDTFSCALFSIAMVSEASIKGKHLSQMILNDIFLPTHEKVQWSSNPNPQFGPFIIILYICNMCTKILYTVCPNWIISP